MLLITTTAFKLNAIPGLIGSESMPGNANNGPTPTFDIESIEQSPLIVSLYLPWDWNWYGQYPLFFKVTLRQDKLPYTVTNPRLLPGTAQTHQSFFGFVSTSIIGSIAHP